MSLHRVLALACRCRARGRSCRSPRAAHVGLDDGDAQLVDEVVVAAEEARTCAWPSGPPWMSTSTGRRPVKRAGGMLSRPEIVRPSKLVQRTICCSAKRGRVDARRRVRRASIAARAPLAGSSDDDLARALARCSSANGQLAASVRWKLGRGRRCRAAACGVGSSSKRVGRRRGAARRGRRRWRAPRAGGRPRSRLTPIDVPRDVPR